MSTKASIFYVDGLHIYTDCLDEEMISPIYFDLHANSDIASTSMCLTLPPHAILAAADRLRSTIEEVRKRAAESDEEIEKHARDYVTERLQHEDKGKGNVSTILRSAGWGVYGDPDRPAEDQISQGIEELERRREQACKEIAAFDEAVNTDGEYPGGKGKR